MTRVLVIAYGNPLRSDDGIAWHVADKLSSQLPSTAQIMRVHQLTPELAEDMSRAELVVFLDASARGQPGDVSCEAVSVESGKSNFSHYLAPQEMLGVCERLYAAKPNAFLISVSGEIFDHGPECSVSAVRAVPLVLEKVSGLMRQLEQESEMHAPLACNIAEQPRSGPVTTCGVDSPCPWS